MIAKLSGKSSLYPIIGDPVTHAKSPERLTEVFATLGHDGVCVPMEVPHGELADVMDGLLAVRNVRGLLLTMPHKTDAFDHCATRSETSELLKVVSVTRRNEDGRWHGDMLDGLSFVEAQKKAGARLEGAQVLQVGAGAVGSAIAIALLDAGVGKLILYDTDEARLGDLVALLAGRGRGEVVAGPADPTGCDLVVNATPLGLGDDDPLPLPTHLLTASMFVGDVIAREGVTPLLQAARDAGCRTADGVQMVEAVMEIMPDFLLGR